MSEKKIALALGQYISFIGPMGLVVFSSVPAFGDSFEKAIGNLIGLSKKISDFQLAKLDPAYRSRFRTEDDALSLNEHIERDGLTPQMIEPVPGTNYIGAYGRFNLRDFARETRPLLNLPIDEESLSEIPLHKDIVLTASGGADLEPGDRVFDDEGQQTFGPPLPKFEP